MFEEPVGIDGGDWREMTMFSLLIMKKHCWIYETKQHLNKGNIIISV